MDHANKPLTMSKVVPPTDPQVSTVAAAPEAAAPEAAARGAAAPAVPAAPTFSGLAHALRRRWLMAVTVAVVGGATVVFSVFEFWPAKYTAAVLLQVAARPERPLFDVGHQEDDFAVYKAHVASIIKSPLVLNRALNNLRDLTPDQSDPVAWLEAALKTDYVLAPDTLRVKLGCDRADEAAKILNAIVKALFQELQEKEDATRKRRLDLLEENQREEEKLQRNRYKLLRDQEDRLRLEDIETAKNKYQAALEEVKEGKKAVRDNRLKQIDAKEELRTLEDDEKNVTRLPVPAAVFKEAFEKEPAARISIANLGKVEQELIQVRQTAVDPQLVKATEQQKEKVLKDLEALRERLRPKIEKDIRADLHEDLKHRIAGAQRRLESLQKQEETLGRDLARLEDEARRLNPAHRQETGDMVALRKEIARKDEALQKLGIEIAKLRVVPAAPSRVSLLQPAVAPNSKDLSRHYRVAGVAGVGLFSLLFFGICWLEFRSGKISVASDVSQGLRMSVVGTVPALPPRARRGVAAGDPAKEAYWQQQLGESVDAIRTLLLHASRTEQLHVIMVTSALGGEGKTSLASQLAASLARAWRKTVLVDGDLRHPALHKLFELPGEPGLSEVLRAEVDVSDAVRPTNLSRLWLMPAGHWDSHAVQALAQDGVGVFQKLQDQYDFVIVDSSPVLPVTDALLMGQQADAVIFSVLRDVSRAPAVSAAQQRLKNLGVRVLGAVVIGDRGGATYQYPAQSA